MRHRPTCHGDIFYRCVLSNRDLEYASIRLLVISSALALVTSIDNVGIFLTLRFSHANTVSYSVHCLLPQPRPFDARPHRSPRCIISSPLSSPFLMCFIIPVYPAIAISHLLYLPPGILDFFSTPSSLDFASSTFASFLDLSDVFCRPSHLIAVALFPSIPAFSASLTDLSPVSSTSLPPPSVLNIRQVIVS